MAVHKALVFVAAILFALPAHAHRPYLVKQGVLQEENGSAVIIEKLYGDGIIVSDPAVLQVRSLNGAILARSPVGGHVAIFCPYLNFCWAFPYNFTSPFVSGWKLDIASLLYDKPSPAYDFEGDEEEEFKKYLVSASHDSVSSYAFGYPESDSSQWGFVRSPISAFFSPLLIIKDHFFGLLLLLAVTLPTVLLVIISVQKVVSVGRYEYGSATMGALIFCVCLAAYGMCLLVLGLTFSTPWLYMIVSMTVGFLAVRSLMRRSIGPSNSGATKT